MDEAKLKWRCRRCEEGLFSRAIRWTRPCDYGLVVWA